MSSTHHPLFRYGMVLLAVLLAMLIRWPLWPLLGNESPFLLLWPTVLFSAWYAGLRPTLLAIFLSVFGAMFFLIDPLFSFRIDSRPDVVELITFVFLALVIGVLGERMHRASRLAHLEHERLQVTLASIGDGVIATDTQGNVTFLNGVAEELTGYTVAQALGKPLGDIFHVISELTSLPLENPANRVLQTGQPVVLPNHTILIARDGTKRVIGDSAAPIHSRSGVLLGVILVFRDISKRRSAELALQASEQRYRSLTESVPGIISEHDLLTDKVLRTNGLFDVVGYQPNEVPGAASWWFAQIHPDDHAHILELRRQVLLMEHPLTFQYRVRHKDGRYIHVHQRVLPMRDDQGKVVRLVSHTQDVTALKRAEERNRLLADCGATLATATPEYELTLQAIARLAVPALADYCLVHLQDETGCRQVAEAHRNSGRETILREVYRTYRPSDSPQSYIARVIRTGKPELVPEIKREFRRAVLVQHPEIEKVNEILGPRSGIHVPLVARGRTLGCLTLILAESGRRYEAEDLAFAEEIARRAALALDNARLYREVQENDRRKDIFLATLAHELRNPLAPIVSSLEILRLAKPADPTTIHVQEMIDRQVRQLTRLVDDLLDVARITQGKIRLQKRPLNLASVVNQAVETCQPLLEQRRHRLTVSLPPAAVHLVGDQVRLTQVLGNLLTNAIRYTPEGGKISLSGETDRGEVILRVRDNGVGIPVDMQAKVFDLFTQVELAKSQPNTAGGDGGLGIGLSLVKRLIELHDGQIGVYSPGPGQGTEFWVRLPALGEPPVSWNDQDAASVPDGGKPLWRVLVVDDNRDAARSLASLLEIWGHTVRVSHDGPSALQAARQFQPEVVVLDIGLPGELSGHDVAASLRLEGFTSTLLIAVTGFGQEEDLRKSREVGIDHHLVKPVEPDVLRQLLLEKPSLLLS